VSKLRKGIRNLSHPPGKAVSYIGFSFDKVQASQQLDTLKTSFPSRKGCVGKIPEMRRRATEAISELPDKTRNRN
jgi:hypothetical protein